MDAQTTFFKRGMIIEWSGSVASIPPGWVLCDGDNGTSDLRDKFIVGAGNTYAAGYTGGSLTHTHTVNQNSHQHVLQVGDVIPEGSGFDDLTNAQDPSIACDTKSHLPPCYALAYIMKT